jgi:hypothetical protein
MKMKSNEIFSQREFTTSDLILAAFLVSNDYKIEDLLRTNGTRIEFVFRSSRELIRLVNDFWNNKTLVEPQNFFYAIKLIKNRIYSK